MTENLMQHCLAAFEDLAAREQIGNVCLLRTIQGSARLLDSAQFVVWDHYLILVFSVAF
jgi:hypothetical protein